MGVATDRATRSVLPRAYALDISDWLFCPRNGRSNRPRDKICASASLCDRQRRWSAWSNLYHFNYDSAERSKSKLWRFFGFGLAKKSFCCLSWLFLDLIRSWASHGQWWFWALSLSYLGATVSILEARSDENSRPLWRYEQDYEASAHWKWGECFSAQAQAHTRTHTHAHTAYPFFFCEDGRYRLMMGHLLLHLSCLQFARHFLLNVTHTHAHARVHTHTHVHTLTSAHTHTHARTRTHTHTHTHTCVCWVWLFFINCSIFGAPGSHFMILNHDLVRCIFFMHVFWACHCNPILYLIRMLSTIYFHSTNCSSYFAIFYQLNVE